MSVADQLGLTQVVRNTTRRCPAHMDGLVDMGPLDLFVHAVSVAERRWCPQAQLIHCALSPGSTIGGPLRPGTRPARGSSAPSTGWLLELIHSPLSHRLIHQFEWHFMICIRTEPLNMADHDTTWGLT